MMYTFRKQSHLIRLAGWLALLLAAGLFFLAPTSAQAQTAQDGRVVMYFFWGDGCPHCAEAKPVLAELTQKYPQLEIRSYEVWYVDANQKVMFDMAAAYGFEPSGVPTIFLGEKYWTGYSDAIGEDIEASIQTCVQTGCKDIGPEIASLVQGVENELPGEHVPDPAVVSLDPGSGGGVDGEAQLQDSLTLPIIGTVSLETQPLFLSTLLIAFVDGFNPCSLWVLSMLLALTLHTGSRKKVLIIGLIFLTVTAAVYALFIAGLFTIFTFTSFLGWIQVVVALVALFFAVINIKDYFWYKEGLSFTIADEKKPGIARSIRRVMDAGQSFWGMAGATVIMAAGVSLVEFSCTAGFPVLWTNLLAAQGVTAGIFVALLLVYMLIYQLDELVIFITAVYTLKASKLEEKQGRILKLIGGMLMLTLAVIMLVNPALMNNLNSSLIIFGGALAAAGLVLFIHRLVLPRFGIWIGSEASGKGARRRAKGRK